MKMFAKLVEGFGEETVEYDGERVKGKMPLQRFVERFGDDDIEWI